MLVDAGTSASSRLSVNSSNHSRRSRKRFPAACWLSSLLISFLVVERSRRFPDACSSTRKLAGLEEELDESCQRIIFPFLVRCGFGPLVHPYEQPSRVFQMTKREACHRVFALSLGDQDRGRIAVHFFTLLFWP